MRVAVVGGGAVGVTATRDLAVAGADVTLYEKGEIASGSTGRAAGVLYDAFAAPEDAAVADRALARFRELSGENGFEFVETPYLWFAREGDDRASAAIREQVPRMREQGRDVSLVGVDDLDSRFPALRTAGIGTAALAENAGWTRPASYADAVAREATRAGATIRTGTAATVETDPLRAAGQRYDAVLVAAGAHTKRVLADAGISVALKPYRVQALVADTDARAFPMVYDATAGYYVRPHPDGLLAGDGTQLVESDPDDWKRTADDAFRAETRERAAERVAGVSATVRDAWAGLCTATPDRDPLLGELESGLYVAAGWQGHGFMRAPAVGEAIANDILGDGGIPEFDPARFTGNEAFEIAEGMDVAWR